VESDAANAAPNLNIQYRFVLSGVQKQNPAYGRICCFKDLTRIPIHNGDLKLRFPNRVWEPEAKDYVFQILVNLNAYA
jgi:hypothetical protein